MIPAHFCVSSCVILMVPFSHIHVTVSSPASFSSDRVVSCIFETALAKNNLAFTYEPIRFWCNFVMFIIRDDYSFVLQPHFCRSYLWHVLLSIIIINFVGVVIIFPLYVFLSWVLRREVSSTSCDTSVNISWL